MKKIIRFLSLLGALIMLLGTVSAFAMTPYTTYTYSMDGFIAYSPDAYTPDRVLDYQAMQLDSVLNDPRDMFVDQDTNYVYLADTKNNRIVVLNQYLQFVRSISNFVNDQGVPDSLLQPQGVYVREGKIYVADTQNNRIVILDEMGNFLSLLETPESDVFPEGSVYTPVSIAVDDVGRVYVVSSTTYQGIIVMNPAEKSNDPSKVFVGFIGATEVNLTVWDLMWRRFQTKEQRASGTQYVSTEYNNIAIDSGNFVYATTSSIDSAKQQESTLNNTKKNAPVRKYNANGIDVLKRTGFFGPGGEVQVASTLSVTTENTTAGAPTGASEIVDVALGQNGVWSILDAKRSKIFTYDSYGELLYVFGDKGQQLGNVDAGSALDYQGSNILVLDRTNATITVYRRTEYGDLLATAIENRETRQYEKTVSDWESIKQRNSNFDAAYIGIGNGYRNQSEYKEAMRYYKYAYDVTNYSAAFKNLRQDWITRFPWVVPIVIVAIVLAYYFFFRYVGKVNVKGHTKTTKRTFWEEILYGFHLIFHPFDGFWDLKHEKRGSIRGAVFYIFITIIAFTYKSVGSSYMMNPSGNYMSIFSVIVSVAAPLLLWCVSNWCLTTLFDGEGSFKDIFIATSYALVPLALILIPTTIASYIVIESEIQVINFLCGIAYAWTGFLVFFGSMVTHDYSFGKNVLICIFTLVGVVFIVFLALLFVSLINQIISFVLNIVLELTYRV